jgi:Protein kinase domain.
MSMGAQPSHTEKIDGPPLKESFETGVQKWRKTVGGEMTENEKSAFLDLMRRMLQFRPEERLTAEEVLSSEWMVKWALPDYERSQKA